MGAPELQVSGRGLGDDALGYVQVVGERPYPAFGKPGKQIGVDGSTPSGSPFGRGTSGRD